MHRIGLYLLPPLEPEPPSTEPPAEPEPRLVVKRRRYTVTVETQADGTEFETVDEIEEWEDD